MAVRTQAHTETETERVGKDVPALQMLTPAERIVARCLPSLADCVFVCMFLGVLLGMQGKLLGLDGDAAWNLRIGTQVLEHGVPRTEFLLSSTYGQPTLFYEWLAQAIYALALRLGGLNGVVALAAAFVALETTLLFVFIRRRGVTLPLALLLTLMGAFLTSSTWTARAQHFTLLLTLLWAEAIWCYWRSGNPRWLWFFPLSMVLWVNLHGGFIGGILLLGTATAVAWLFPTGRERANPRHLSLALAATFAATLINPWGPSLWPHIYGYLRDPLMMQTTKEFQSPDFHTAYALVFLALVFALVGTWLWLARRGAATPALSPLAVALTVVWTALAMQSVRFVALWALVALPILGEALAACLATSRANAAAKAGEVMRTRWRHVTRRSGGVVLERSRRIEALDAMTGRGVWAALALIFVLAILLNGGALPGSSTRILNAQWDTTTFPVQAAQRLHAEGLPSGNGFTTYTWGSYLDYALPEYHPFVDSRSDTYGEKVLREYLDIISLAPDWRRVLDRYHMHWALLPTGEPLAQALALSPGWSCHAEDDQGIAVLCIQMGGQS